MMAALPEVTDWVGAVGVGIVAAGVEYFDEPAMAAILLEAPTDQYQVFSGIAPLPAVLPGAHPTCSTRFTARSALVHSDVQTQSFLICWPTWLSAHIQVLYSVGGGRAGSPCAVCLQQPRAAAGERCLDGSVHRRFEWRRVQSGCEPDHTGDTGMCLWWVFLHAVKLPVSSCMGIPVC